jgi:hypothetical protein
LRDKPPGFVYAATIGYSSKHPIKSVFHFGHRFIDGKVILERNGGIGGMSAWAVAVFIRRTLAQNRRGRRPHAW